MLKKRDELGKIEFINKIKTELGITQNEATRFYDCFTGTIREAIADGRKVQLHNFGTFTVKHSPERTGRNPQTKEMVRFPAKKRVTFKASKKLVDVAND